MGLSSIDETNVNVVPRPEQSRLPILNDVSEKLSSSSVHILSALPLAPETIALALYRSLFLSLLGECHFACDPDAGIRTFGSGGILFCFVSFFGWSGG